MHWYFGTTYFRIFQLSEFCGTTSLGRRCTLHYAMSGSVSCRKTSPLYLAARSFTGLAQRRCSNWPRERPGRRPKGIRGFGRKLGRPRLLGWAYGPV